MKYVATINLGRVKALKLILNMPRLPAAHKNTDKVPPVTVPALSTQISSSSKTKMGLRQL